MGEPYFDSCSILFLWFGATMPWTSPTLTCIGICCSLVAKSDTSARYGVCKMLMVTSIHQYMGTANAILGAKKVAHSFIGIVPPCTDTCQVDTTSGNVSVWPNRNNWEKPLHEYRSCMVLLYNRVHCRGPFVTYFALAFSLGDEQLSSWAIKHVISS